MTPDEELLTEIKKISRQLDVLTNPFKQAWFNFRAGVFHSLGNLFGTAILAVLIVYLFSQLRLGQLFTQWFQGIVESTINQIIPSLTPSNPFGI